MTKCIDTASVSLSCPELEALAHIISTLKGGGKNERRKKDGEALQDGVFERYVVILKD